LNPENKSLVGSIVMYEEPLFSIKHKFAGKPDAVFSKAIIDFKRSPGDTKIHALQLAGYHTLAKENHIAPATKIWLILWFDGKKFKAKNVYDIRAENIFLQLVKKYYIDQEITSWMNKN
jgi:hypothetical protein